MVPFMLTKLYSWIRHTRMQMHELPTKLLTVVTPQQGGRAFRASMGAEVVLLLFHHVCFCAAVCCIHVVPEESREKEKKEKEGNQ